MQCLGQQEFAIPDNVLGIVYGQTICWIGAFFSPLLPAIATLKFIIIFYVKEVRRGGHGGWYPEPFLLEFESCMFGAHLHPVRCIKMTSLIGDKDLFWQKGWMDFHLFIILRVLLRIVVLP